MTTVRTPADPTDSDIELSLRSSRRLEGAPEHVIQRAIATWMPRHQAAAAPGPVARLLAVLTFDSGAASPLAFGTRSAGGTTRQMLFSAQGHDVDLRVSPAGGPQADHWLLSGQVLGPEARGAVALTDALGETVGETTLDELGEFRLPAITPGQYTVTLRLGISEIVLPSILVPQET
ncbi:MAG: carboxypeptidase-like regulatory domain-containing protein [Rubrivivax sp.]|nr:carboxypeptidase-like regulatory domain-containing protein [Rubrivivax sp.]MDP3223566.1 carboxypeptidase-like regulatory domain-containing protein [Rubrivivax sp.]